MVTHNHCRRLFNVFRTSEKETCTDTNLIGVSCLSTQVREYKSSSIPSDFYGFSFEAYLFCEMDLDIWKGEDSERWLPIDEHIIIKEIETT